jgi:hypothetical protein
MNDVTSNMDPDARDGLTVRVSVEVTDFWRLGAWLAEQGSEDQAAFLHGLQTGFQEMGVVESRTSRWGSSRTAHPSSA